MRASIIIPTLDEAETIVSTLTALQAAREAGCEVIVADGGSADGTPARCTGLVDRLLCAPSGRARQMNAGSALASGEYLFFLHADTRLTIEHVGLAIRRLEEAGRAWGRFDIRLSGTHPLLRVIERLMNLRSRWSGIATGDQVLFVRRPVFERVGGFAQIPIMEDIEVCKRLKRLGPPLCLRERVVTSSRRWERYGILRTIALMWALRLGYFVGLSPRVLVRYYASR
ncbi:MAG: TIGR04283 family arsenosugar biosynthesis glycosyltransferase [Gammaproteobacteria bacterium]